MSNQLTYEALAQNAQTNFRIAVGPERFVEVELAEVGPQKLGSGQEQFSIVFRGPNDAYLDQGTRSFSHELLGEFELFLVPIRQDARGIYYEAVFNRFIDRGESGS